MTKNTDLRTSFGINTKIPDASIRLALDEDVASMLRVYTPYILDTTVTFEYDIPSLSDFAQRMAVIRQTYPVLVCEVDSEIVGYAYASVFKPRSAYQWTAETVIYFKPDFAGRGFGKILYGGLIDALKLQGVCQGVAVITSSNERSIEFHKQMGFQSVAKLVKVGYKFGEWLDVNWMQYHFSDLKENPDPMIPIEKIVKEERFLLLIASLNERLNNTSR